MREEIWRDRIARVKVCIDAGMNQSETAKHLGVSRRTVKAYAIRAQFDTGATLNLQRIRECAASGLTRAETGSKLGLSLSTIGNYGREYGILFRHAGVVTYDPRSETMAAMFTAGRTLEEIGVIYSVTRERVRQILKKYHGIVGRDGGKAAKAAARRKTAAAKRNAKFQARYGCSYTQYKDIAGLSKDMQANGSTYCKAPLGAYRAQERNAKLRGIEWCLSLIDWWDIWQRSGKWEQRGRGRGYMMCRFGDIGPYAVGNVYIATGIHNGSVQPNNPYRAGHPDHERVMAQLSQARAA